MKKLILSLSLAVCALSVQAATSIDVSKLTPDQVKQLTTQVNEMASTPTNVSASVRKEAEAWGDLGANMGKAMVGAAKEVGLAANEFSQTSLGKVTVAIVAYKIIGQDILHVLFGSFVLVVGYALALWLVITRRWSNIEYSYEPGFKGWYTVKRVVKCDTPSDTVVGQFIGAAVLLLLSTLTGLSSIFH